MNTKRLLANRTVPHWFVALSGLALISSVQAQQAPYYNQPPRYSVPPGSPPPRTYTPPAPPPAYQQQPQSTPSRVGGFFRRLFYGESSSPQGQGQYYGAPQGRSLDTPPAGYRPGMGFNEPPQSQPQPKIDTNPPTTSARTGGSRRSSEPTTTKKSGTTKKYTPPKVKEDAPPSKPKAPTIGTEPSAKPKISEPSPEPKFTPEPDPDIPNEPLPGFTPPSSTPPAGAGMATPKLKDPEPTTGTSNSGAFLVGKKTGKEGRVTSPYPPYKELDVTGLPSGSLALDPTTQKVFEVP
ncbi:MAG: hypothetical protein KDK97_07590 [Verrucomicrobiales bacterium]|nr:hypothetical protein [Verrucomicrobiales bacterium]MCP5557992.1 hypothetical protein [Verrucomicrobiaceae bacterium]